MAPRPGRIHKEYNLPFASMGLKEDLREIKNLKDFTSKREEILTMIWNMEEEIMGKENYSMFTQFITFAIIVAIIGCIMYGRKLIRTEKIDAVFGNPERAKGGTHWIIVGSSVILLTWLYYSWDIAKSFYPQSANELCQVGKVNDSLLSLKYLFPIEEREFKSTSIIKSENKNIIKLKNEIQNSKEISEQHRSFLIN